MAVGCAHCLQEGTTEQEAQALQKLETPGKLRGLGTEVNKSGLDQNWELRVGLPSPPSLSWMEKRFHWGWEEERNGAKVLTKGIWWLVCPAAVHWWQPGRTTPGPQARGHHGWQGTDPSS